MPKTLVTRLIRVALAAAFTIAFADRLVAAPILLSHLQIHVGEDDELGLVADITGGLDAQAFDVFFDGYQVLLEEDGTSIDPFVPPIVFVDSPFYSLFSLPAGASLPDDTLLFRIGGLTAGTRYTGSIALFQFEMDGSIPALDPQAFEFTAPAPVPEPGTLVLTGLGAAALLRRRRTLTRRHS
jgi:hypothetical protein